jgi:hypothetical protein
VGNLGYGAEEDLAIGVPGENGECCAPRFGGADGLCARNVERFRKSHELRLLLDEADHRILRVV